LCPLIVFDPSSGETRVVADDLVPEPQGLQLAALAVLFERLVRDQSVVVDFVAVRLAQALPGAVNVRRHGLAGRGPVEAVRVTIGDQRFELQVRGAQVEATQSDLVSGVALRHDRLTVRDWLAGLLAALDRWAVESDAARAALEQLS